MDKTEASEKLEELIFNLVVFEEDAVFLNQPLSIWIGDNFVEEYGIFVLPKGGALYVPFKKYDLEVKLGYRK